MGCAVFLIVALGVIIGLVLLPTIVDVANLFHAPGWSPLESIVYLLPVAFLFLVFLGVLKWMSKI